MLRLTRFQCQTFMFFTWSPSRKIKKYFPIRRSRFPSHFITAVTPTNNSSQTAGGADGCTGSGVGDFMVSHAATLISASCNSTAVGTADPQHPPRLHQCKLFFYNHNALPLQPEPMTSGAFVFLLPVTWVGGSSQGRCFQCKSSALKNKLNVFPTHRD